IQPAGTRTPRDARCGESQPAPARWSRTAPGEPPGQAGGGAGNRSRTPDSHANRADQRIAGRTQRRSGLPRTPRKRRSLRMKLSRREFAKANAAAIAATAAGLPLISTASNLITEADMTRLDWNKAPCRFCGTGCSVMVATRDNRVVATHGDVKAEVNRGLNCVKGYFLSKIMYGVDRLTQPLLRMKNGVYDKQGEFQPVSWDQAFDIMEQKIKQAIAEHGPEAVGMFGSGQWTVWEGYAANKLMKAGFRSNNIDPNARHCMASAVMGFMRTFGMDEPMGCYDDIEAADAFVLWGSNMAEMHPILWSRVTDRRLSHPNTRVAV